jgi:hypothetical protein
MDRNEYMSEEVWITSHGAGKREGRNIMVWKTKHAETPSRIVNIRRRIVDSIVRLPHKDKA